MFQDPPVTVVDEVVVTAPRLPPAAGDAAFSVTRIGEETLAGEARLDEALGAVPAVGLFRRNTSLTANPTTQGLSLRAVAPTGAGRALVTLDGVPLNDPFGGWVIWSRQPVEGLSGLDVVRAGGSGPWGAGALTGAVVLRERDDGGAVSAAIGQRGSARIAASGTGDLGPLRWIATAGHERTEGHVPVRAPDRGAADRALDLDALSGSLRLDMPVGPVLVSARAAAFREERGSGLDGARATAEGTSLSLTAARAPTAGAPGWRVQLWRSTSDLQNSSAAVAADRASTTPANDQYATPATAWGVNAAWRLRRGGLEGELGLDARTAEGETNERFRFMSGQFTRTREAGGETSVVGAYAEGSWTKGPWLVAGGLRLDRWEATGAFRREADAPTGAPTLDAASPDRSGEVVSARLGVRRALTSDWSVRAAAYSAFRPATLNELHRPFRVGNDVTEANAALEPERLTGAEIGLARETDRLDLRATAFAVRVEDAVVNVTVGFGPGTYPVAGFIPAGGVLRQRRNAGVIDAVGLELDAAWRPVDGLDLRAALSATDARLDGGSAAPQLTGLRPAQAAIWSATAGADWTFAPDWTLSADARWESRRFDDDLNARVLDPALTLDARLERAFGPAAVWVEVLNLTDADLETAETGTGVASFAPPRTVWIGVSRRW
ncbi:MAG TPA: TonB-dependent receptor [Brevundimonas sp.]|jgi:outer membrane receptor protein involved in Fe transport|uniref:TonB-dependent receptor n=1 Tax=Brevundimonas sp. TaxID=1871086 RepID=UPI002DF33C9A|nr:TonB-dependent receptor [Brevundimonas sp.]